MANASKGESDAQGEKNYQMQSHENGKQCLWLREGPKAKLGQRGHFTAASSA